MPDTDPYDYAHDGTAWVHRTLKAEKLARWCWLHGITRLPADTDPRDLRGIARRARVNPPRAGTTDTWDRVRGMLDAMTGWARAHPGDPRARTGVPACCTCDPLRCALDDTGDHCTGKACAWCLHGCPATATDTCCTPQKTTPTEGSRT